VGPDVSGWTKTMRKFQRAAWILAAVVAMAGLQGCLVTKVVTVPVKVAYGVGKLAVKGTAAAVRAVVPDDDKNAQKPATPDDTAPQEQPAKP